MRFRLGKPAQVALFAEVPLLILAWWLFQEQRADAVAIDFTDAFLTAAHAVVHGHSPYPGLHSPSVAGGYAYVYPPLAAFVFAPFAVLPHAVAAWAATVVVVACFFGALHLFGVRDWRCYGVAILWKPSLFAIQTANLSLLLLLLAAIAWQIGRAHV